MSPKSENTKSEFAGLMPVLSEKQRQDIIVYRKLAEPYTEEFNLRFKRDFIDHPIFGPFLKSIPESVMKEMNAASRKLEEEAIYKNNWEPYIKNLIQQGVQYVHMGLDLRAWYEVLSLVREYMVPVFEKEYEKDLKQGAAATRGMNTFLDIGMRTIGESFIHERNRLIEKQTKQQETLIKELESFAYIISHDLKTPLRGIASLADWIAQDYSDKLDDTGKEYIELLKSRVTRLEKLIDGVLTYSRAGRVEANLEETDFNQLVTDTIEMIAPPANVKINIENTLPKSFTYKVPMSQVFANLISNAIKHNDKAQVNISIGSEEDGKFWKFHIRDNGPGIEKEFHEKIFQIFQTLKTKDEMNSTGIGLSVVKKIIESNGGKIWIESKQGEGSTFFFTIKK